MLSSVYDDLDKNGYTITPANGKRPLGNGWQHRENDPSWKKYAADKNVGIVLGDRLIAIDIDILNEDMAKSVLASAQSAFGFAPVRFGNKPKCLMLIRINEAMTKHKIKFKFDGLENPAVEILANGQQFIAYGTHPDTKKPYVWDLNAGDEPINTTIDELPSANVQQVRAWLVSLKPMLEQFGAHDVTFDGFTPDNVQKVLPVVVGVIDDEEDDFKEFQIEDEIEGIRADLVIQEKWDKTQHDDWVHVGFMLKRWDYDKGYVLWREWSACPEHPDACTVKVWDGLRDTSEKKITVASLRYEANKVRKRNATALSIQSSQTLSQLISSCSNVTDMEGVVADTIRSDLNLSAIGRETIIGEWRNRFKILGNVIISVGIARKLLTPTKLRQLSPETPAFCLPWVWLNDRDKFYHLYTKEEISKQSFDANYTREILDNGEDEGASRGAANFALNNNFIKCFSRAIYMPQNLQFFPHEGLECVNAFSVDSLPQAEDKISDDGKLAVDLVIKHIRNICGKREKETRFLLDFIAYNTQNIGKKINFAPLIQGFEGDGKSTIAEVIACCLGGRNVKPLPPTALQDKFTGWAEGSCVVVLEELRVAGHNRFDVLDTIKPMITNATIDIRRMNRDNYSIVNVTNYIAFTNHRDALPLNDHDRRWWVIFAPYLNRQDMERDVGDIYEYFDKLKNAITYHGGSIRRFFLDFKISEDFKPYGHAPLTAEKLSMISAEKGAEICDLNTFIQKGGVGYSDSIISSSALTSAMGANSFSDYEFPELNTKTIRRILEGLGYMKFDKQVKWQGKPHRVWVKRSRDLDAERCRQLLNETLAVDDDF
jgi:hypothetical protein